MSQSETATVLYIEDNRVNLEIVRRMLTYIGYTVLQAETGISGVEMAIDKQPDLILVDMFLPDIGGADVIKALRGTLDYDVPILVITASEYPKAQQACKNAGCNGFMMKPVSRSDLLKTVKRHLQISSSSVAG